MNSRLIITKQQNRIISSLFEEDDLVQINVATGNSESLLGNIYIGKVKNIVKNINAAFVEIEKGIMCYYSLDDNKNPIFTNSKKNNNVNIGDEIIVQISKENIKTKAPVVTCNINLTGKYIVLTHGKNMIGISNKIVDDKERTRLKNILHPFKNEECGFIIRTNAIHAEESFILNEIEHLLQVYKNIKEFGSHRTPFSLIQKTPPTYICDIRDGFANSMEEIVTDDKEIYEEIRSYLQDFQKEDQDKLRFYEDRMISLSNLYSISTKLENALKEKIWLKSGGSIIIQPTEAFVVIDVNTGKAVGGKKKSEDTFFKINMEAAKEIAKQMRLRNLSGIIIIDFIDMESKEHRDHLMTELEHLFNKDPIKTILVDITSLNLVEVTRKKVRKPLYEQCMIPCEHCGGTGRILI